MIPLRHTTPGQSTAYATRGLVALNAIIFASQFLKGRSAETILSTFAFIPARLLSPASFGFARWEVGITLLTSLFLHGGFVHLFGNMIYLWVFGGAVEESFGHGLYVAFYLACGVIGSLTHTLFFPQSIVPSIGASGAIAGVLGAFLVLRPKARILTLLPLVVYWALIEIRGFVFLPMWFALQFFNGFLALASARGTQEVVGVAWWAHVGGFTFGVLAALLFRRARRRRTMRTA